MARTAPPSDRAQQVIFGHEVKKMRGRKPLPPHLKLVKTGKKPRGKGSEVEFLQGGPPDPPDFLMSEAVEEWHRLASGMYATGLLTQMDRGPFAAYVQSYARWREAERLLAAGDLVVVT